MRVFGRFARSIWRGILSTFLPILKIPTARESHRQSLGSVLTSHGLQCRICSVHDPDPINSHHRQHPARRLLHRRPTRGGILRATARSAKYDLPLESALTLSTPVIKGLNFSTSYHIWIGSTPSSHCQLISEREYRVSLPPRRQRGEDEEEGGKRKIVVVRRDGVVFPSRVFVA
jgi:hypothetical protein